MYFSESMELLVSSVVIDSVSKARSSDVVSKNRELIMGVALFCNHESPAYHSVVKAGWFKMMAMIILLPFIMATSSDILLQLNCSYGSYDVSPCMHLIGNPDRCATVT